VLSLLAHPNGPNAAIASLHEQALQLTGGSCSLLFAYSPRAGRMQAASGFALAEPRTEPWIPTALEAAVVAEAFTRRRPIFVADAKHRTPDLAARLRTPAALLVPLLAGERRAGLLVIGFRSARTPPGADTTEIAYGFLVAVELFRLRQQEELQRDLRELLHEFAATVSATLDITTGLDIVCHRATRLFGAERTSVWIYDRGRRHLALRASSDRQQRTLGTRVGADDLEAPAAAAMRRSRSAALPRQATTRTVTVPLRGYRRALGAIVIEGVRMDARGELNLLERADELGRQLSSAIDGLQLLEEVLRSRGELESVFDSMPSLIVVTDGGGRIVHVNEAFAGRLHVSRERLHGRLLADCVGPELGAWIGTQSQPGVRDAGISVTRAVVDPLLGGPFTVTLTDRFDRDGASAGVILIARDLSADSRLDLEREAARQRHTQSEKLAALGHFVAGIAHELNNPLQGVLGHADLLRETNVLPRPLRPAIRTIYREADRAAKIVRNLLVFAGSRRMTRHAVSLHTVLHKVVTLRQAACEAQNIEVVRHYAEGVPRVHGDSLLLHQVFLNLVMNAEEAIATAKRPGRIDIATAVVGDRVVTTIHDTGDGIDPFALTRIFEPFYTTKEVGQGTGLGLAIAFGIVQEHGGQITAANHPGGGAVMTVDLPAAPSRERRR
jgi:signal transduction histidine kinase